MWTNHSSIFSSDRPNRVGGIPWGAVTALLLVLILHVWASYVKFPQPVARERLRQRIQILTRECRPRLIVGGDSRAAWQIHPSVVAQGLRWPVEDAVSIADTNCDSSCALAAYREFADRFAPSPILLLTVSLWSVNDQGKPLLENDELLWSLSFRDRCSLAGPTETLRGVFTPERRLFERLKSSWRGGPSVVPEFGFDGRRGIRPQNFPADAVKRQVRLLEKEWYAGSNLDGVRWRALERDVEMLLDLGARVVLVDPPQHPLWTRRIQGTPLGDVDNRFHLQLVHLAERLGIPLLRYGEAFLNPHDADEIFFDLMHLNRRGAILLSAAVGKDLVGVVHPMASAF
jgi:hypothetical protein